MWRRGRWCYGYWYCHLCLLEGVEDPGPGCDIRLHCHRSTDKLCHAPGAGLVHLPGKEGLLCYGYTFRDRLVEEDIVFLGSTGAQGDIVGKGVVGCCLLDSKGGRVSSNLQRTVNPGEVRRGTGETLVRPDGEGALLVAEPPAGISGKQTSGSITFTEDELLLT